MNPDNLWGVRRVAYSVSAGLGGVMIWEVVQDCRLEPTVHADGSSHVRTCPGDGDEQSLLAAITRAMAASGVVLQRFGSGGAAESAEAAKSEL